MAKITALISGEARMEVQADPAVQPMLLNTILSFLENIFHG